METATKRTAEQAERGAVEAKPTERGFRFYDNRQKYLLFVNTCAEKWAVSERIARELPLLRPRPPALRVFDAGVGDGTVLTRVLRSMHCAFPTIPFHVVGKEISLEDVRLTLEKMPDRFFEHPQTVLVLTNLYYKEAPGLTPHSISAASSLVWHEVALSGKTSREFEAQVTELQPFLNENWRTKVSATTGNPVYERPTVLVLYRADHRFLLESVIPRRPSGHSEYDLVIASQPYRLRASLEFKAGRVIAPLAKALAPSGRLIAVHSRGGDPGHEILQGVWPDENPFQHDRYQLLQATKQALGQAAKRLKFNQETDQRALFRYSMHALPSEIEETIGTSTVFAAWNAAVYVGQIEDARLEAALRTHNYLDVTRKVLKKHGGLWFWDESCSITRRPD